MRTTGHELRSDAAIYAQGTDYTTDQLAREYEAYCESCEDEPETFQRWIAAEHNPI